MTVAAERLSGFNRAETARWGGSLAVVLALHAVLALYVMSRQVGIEPAGLPPSAVMIDLASLPAPTPPAPAPPEPVVQPQVQPQPEPPPPEPEIKPLPVEPSPAPKPAVALPLKPVHQAKPRPVRPPAAVEPYHPPSPAAPAVSAPPTSAAAPPAPMANAGAARASWQSRLVGWLERYKRYPRLAREQRQEGVAYLRFTIDRQGRVVSAHIEKGSGSSLLDEEVLALVQRAQPLPAPPPEVVGDHIELVVPVRFSLERDAR